MKNKKHLVIFYRLSTKPQDCIYMITATPIYCINAVYNFYIW